MSVFFLAIALTESYLLKINRNIHERAIETYNLVSAQVVHAHHAGMQRLQHSLVPGALGQ